MKISKFIVPLAALGRAGCADQKLDVPDWADGSAWDVTRVEALPVNPDPYLGALQEGYLKLAKSEIATHFDWVDGALYLKRAEDAAGGNPSAPLDPEDRGIERPEDDPLRQGADTLRAYIAAPGPMLRAGRQIGEAQVHYDCWVEQLDEGHQTEEIADCREQFQATLQLVMDLADLPDNMAVVLPKDGVTGGVELTHKSGNSVTLDDAFAAAGVGDKLGDLPVEEGEIRDAFAAALGATPPPPKIFEIYFDFNSTAITDIAHEQIMVVAREALSRDGGEVLIAGHADAVGDTAANRAIARSRAARVARAVDRELPEGHTVEISFRGFGEAKLKVPTVLQEETNRRAVILVR
ncbi:MAG: OmpA family protein [Pseudomonadota bacterium]